MGECRVMSPLTKEVCGKPVTRVVTFKDGDKVRSCDKCAMHLQEVARTHGGSVRVDLVEAVDGRA